MFPLDKSNSGGKKKPAFLRKKPPMPPSDGDESESEMGQVTCPKCGHAFDPDAQEGEGDSMAISDDSY